MKSQQETLEKLHEKYDQMNSDNMDLMELAFVMEDILEKNKISKIQFSRLFYVCLRGQCPFSEEELLIAETPREYFTEVLLRVSKT